MSGETITYEWKWNDEPDFALDHADHITVEKVWLNDEGISDDREEVCIVVVRHPYSARATYRESAEKRARRIASALETADYDDEHPPLYHADDPRSHG